MRVEYIIPSAADAVVETTHSAVMLKPRFYSRGHKPHIGTFVVSSDLGDVFDRVMLMVSSKGRLTLVRQTEEVTASIDEAKSAAKKPTNPSGTS